MTAYQMTAAGVLIAALIGVPSGWFIWGRTHSRMAALTIGLAIGAVAVVVAAWLYYTRVLCPLVLAASERAHIALPGR